MVNKTPMGRALDYVGSVVEAPGRALTAEDEFFKTINYRAELWAQAFRQSMDEIDKGVLPRENLKNRMIEIIQDPPENIRLAAADHAAYNTFTNEPGEVVKQFIRLRESIPGAGYIMPFINTPANILKYTFERTPLAVVSGKFRADVAAGGVKRDMALTKVTLGSAVMGLTYDLALNGSFTGSGPQNPRERAALRRTGWQPYSVRIQTGEDKDGNPTYAYTAYNRLDPLGYLVGIGADLAEWQLNTDQKADAQFNEMFAAAVFSVAQNIKDKSYFRGVSDLVEAMSNPDRFSETYLTRFAGSFVPAIINEGTKASDPHLKYTHDTISKIKSRVPGLSEDIPNRVDLWGRDIKFQSGLGKLYDAVSPIYVSQSKESPIDKEILRLKYHPSHPRYIRIRGENVPLRNQPEALIAFHRYAGGTSAAQLPRDGLSGAVSRRLDSYGNKSAFEYLNAVVSSKHPDSLEYLTEDDDGKADFISKVLSDYRKAAKVRVIDEFPALMDIRNRMDD